MIMKPYWSARLRYEIVIGEKGLAALKTGCLGTNQGVGLIACSVIIDTNLRGLAGVENRGEKCSIDMKCRMIYTIGISFGGVG